MFEDYELNGYADDADKADERGFKKLRYNIDKLKSALSASSAYLN